MGFCVDFEIIPKGSLKCQRLLIYVNFVWTKPTEQFESELEYLSF